jgi:SAM-dependent methyltransferase
LQSFHWFATHAALADILRILKPGGKLGLIWNLRAANVPWAVRLDAIVNRVEGDTPRYYTGACEPRFRSMDLARSMNIISALLIPVRPRT